MRYRIHPVCARAYVVCAAAYIKQKNKQSQGIGMYALAHTRSKQERGTERRRKALKVPERARKKRACAHQQEPASGVAKLRLWRRETALRPRIRETLKTSQLQ